MEISARIAARNRVLRDNVETGARTSVFSLFRWEGYEGVDPLEDGFGAAERERDKDGEDALHVRRMT